MENTGTSGIPQKALEGNDGVLSDEELNQAIVAIRENPELIMRLKPAYRTAILVAIGVPGVHGKGIF